MLRRSLGLCSLLLAVAVVPGCGTATPAPPPPPPAPSMAWVDGTWTLVITAPAGERTMTLEIEQTGDKLVVTMTGPAGVPITGEGSVAGARVNWTVMRPAGEDEVALAFVGVVDRDTMSGTAVLPRRELPWTATR